VPVVSAGGAPVEVSPTLKIAIVRDPNNLLLELVERRAALRSTPWATRDRFAR